MIENIKLHIKVMSSKNIEMKSLSTLSTLSTPSTLSTTTPNSNTQTYDVKEETNSNIRYLMSYYGYQ
jgi:hypothetical protein